MTKYQKIFQDMISQNKEFFEQFQMLHEKYSKEPKKYQKEFDEQGRDAQDIIRRYENILCGKSESTGYSKFSSNLSEKFQKEVRIVFPKIDCVGLE